MSGDMPKVKITRAVARLLKMIFVSGKLVFFCETVIVVLCSLLPVMTAFLWQRILERMDRPPSELFVLFLSMAISGGLMLSNGYFREVFDTIFRNTVAGNMQKRVHEKAQRLPMDDYEDAALNDLLTCAGEKFFYGDVLGFIIEGVYAVQVLISIVLTGCLVWGYHPALELPLLGMLAAQALGIRLNKKRTELDLALVPMKRKQEVYKEYLTKHENIKEIQSLGAHTFFREKWRSALREAMTFEERASRKIETLRAAEDVLKRLAVIVSYLLCVILAERGMVGIGQFGALILLMQQFQNSSSDFVERIQYVHASAVHVQNGIAYFELPEEQRERTLNHSVSEITLEGVSYRYPQTESAAVENISMKLKKNEIVAVVGKNGSGKTTFSKLVSGLLVPTEGNVYFDGIPSSEIENGSLYSGTTAVMQDFVRYCMTVRENIILGDCEKPVSDEAIEKLIRDMRITFVSGKTGITLDTDLGVEYGGMELSGGQWQQLAILRAKYKDADLVILDEPTAALDPLKEAELFSAFQQMCRGRIGVIITHRLSMCSFADTVLFMDKGKILEMGSHRELLARGGSYARVYQRQAEMYKSE